MPLFTVPSTDVKINYLVQEPESVSTNGHVEANSTTAAAAVAVPPPTALLIHGWSCSLNNYAFQIPFLAGQSTSTGSTETGKNFNLNYRVIAVDLRGHGSSTPDHATKDYSMHTLSTDLIALLTHLGYTGDSPSPSTSSPSPSSKVLIIGHSAGSVIASTISVLRPDLVTGVIMLDPAYVVPSEGAPYLIHGAQQASSLTNAPEWVANSVFDTETMMSADIQPWLKTWILNTVRSTDNHAVCELLVQGWGETYVDAKSGEIRECYATWPKFKDWADRNGRNEKCKRRLVIYDSKVKAELEVGMGVVEGRDRVEYVEGAGHWLHMKEPGKTNEIIGEWLVSVGLA